MSTHAVLFDLDGTLASTGDDLVAALNVLRAERSMEPIGLEKAKPFLSSGSSSLLRNFLCEQHEDVEPHRQRFFAAYADQDNQHSRLFDGVPEMLDQLEELGFIWGIVTNKIERLTWPLLDKLELRERSGTIICGDTAARAKPHPDPLIEACKQCDVQPQNALFLGDDPIDQQAAQACGMPFSAVSWSEMWTGDCPVVINQPADVFAVLVDLGWLEL